MSKIRILGKTVFVSAVSQGVSSAANFLLAIFLIRHLSLEDFGLYGISFAIVLLYSGIGEALFLTQMVANAPDWDETHRPEYFGRVLLLLVSFAVLTLSLTGVLLLMWWELSDVSHELLLYWASTSMLSVCYLLKGFYIRCSYIVCNEILALKINVFSATLMLVMMLLFWTSQRSIYLPIVLLIYSVSQIIGACIGHYLSIIRIRSHSLSEIRQGIGESWRNGRWMLGGVGVNWLQSQAYVGLTAVALGPTGVGLANAARVFISPFSVLMPAINQVILPRLSALRVHNRPQLVQYGFSIGRASVALGLVYILALYSVLDGVSGFVLKPEYSEAKSLIWVWCLVLCVQLFRSSESNILLALKEYKSITITNAVSATLSLLIGGILTYLFGVLGAISGLLVGEVVFAGLLWVKIKKVELLTCEI